MQTRVMWQYEIREDKNPHKHNYFATL